MNSPLRVVCEGCLRSVEFGLDSTPAESVSCPFCGCRLDSRPSGVSPDNAETRAPRSPLESDTAETPETIDWATAWSRGSLGSLGRFQLRERLGDGGFGQVYLAYDPRLDRDVALKVLKEPDPSDRVMERFFREARAVARLDHPNIVAVHDAGFAEGRFWVAYQLVSGRPLWWYRDRQRMDSRTAARIIRDLADALNHAHCMGVVHRDIKPGNVIIDDRGRPRLIDFGLARRSDVDSDLTRDGVVVGTPAYMSPEQAVGLSKQADERSDVYSLGVILYELLCGRRPHEARMQAAGKVDGATEEPSKVPSVRAVNSLIPAELDTICGRALSPRPADRYPSARALADAIDAWLGRRRKIDIRLITGAIAVVLLAIGGSAAAFLPRVAGKNEARASALSSTATPAQSETASVAKKVARSASSGLSVGPIQLIGNLNSKVYHRSTCTPAQNISESNRINLEDVEDAKSRGLRACEHCKPPGVAVAFPPLEDIGGEDPRTARPPG